MLVSHVQIHITYTYIHMHATCMDVAYISLENHIHQLRGYTCMRSAVCLRRVCGGAPLWLQAMSLSHRVARRVVSFVINNIRNILLYILVLIVGYLFCPRYYFITVAICCCVCTFKCINVFANKCI